jgi:threonyl-tRNA synthetase
MVSSPRARRSPPSWASLQETSKITNILVVGEREQQTESVTLRRYGSRDQETLSFADFQARLAHAITTRAQKL